MNLSAALPLQMAFRLAQLAGDAEDGLALTALAPLAGAFLPWTASSMRPSAILAIVNDIVIAKRTAIVECGSGNSTIFAARALAQHGIDGHVYSVDHDRGWADLTRRALDRENLQQWASVSEAPLVDGWYDKTELPEVTDIDLLVVDGPPAYERALRTSRQPALDVFRERLAPGATIVLDDAWRPGEKRVMAAWRAAHGIELRPQPGGYATGTLLAA